MPGGEERRSHEALPEVRDLQEPPGNNAEGRAGTWSSPGTRPAPALPVSGLPAPNSPGEGKKIPRINLTYTQNPQPLAWMRGRGSCTIRGQPRPRPQRGFGVSVLGHPPQQSTKIPAGARRGKGRGFGGAGSGLPQRGEGGAAEALSTSCAPLTSVVPLPRALPARSGGGGGESPAKNAWQLPTAGEDDEGGTRHGVPQGEQPWGAGGGGVDTRASHK